MTRLLLIVLLAGALGACGREPPTDAEPADGSQPATVAVAPLPESEAESADASKARGLPSDAPRPENEVSGIPDFAAAAAALDAMPTLAEGDDGAGHGDRVPGVSSPAEVDLTTIDAKALAAEFQAAMQELAAAGNDPAKRAAAMQRMEAVSKAMGATRMRRDPSQRRADVDVSLPEPWREVRSQVRDGDEADLVVQLGDIDNLGFGWPEGFDPFSGKSTPIHEFPFSPEDDDPDGTDRIMVVSGYRIGAEGAVDGYTRESSRPDNQPKPMVLEYDASGIQVKAAVLQLFVDDFQSERMGSRYQTWINGREAPDIAATLNALDQTGPIGKLVNIRLLPEYHEAIASGRLEVRIDDPTTDAGDGFAFDFARLLINPRGYRYVGEVRGIARDKSTGDPLPGVLVSAANVKEALTGADGRFVLAGVPAGLVVTSGSKPDYEDASDVSDLEDGQTLDLTLELAPIQRDVETLATQLQRERRVDLYGIYFDTDKATLKPESGDTLRQILGVLEQDPDLSLVIAGHTDSEGGEDYNRSLSERRAASVVAWLVGEGIDRTRLGAVGHGESQPVADNATEAGRALNRRVEVRLDE